MWLSECKCKFLSVNIWVWVCECQYLSVSMFVWVCEYENCSWLGTENVKIMSNSLMNILSEYVGVSFWVSLCEFGYACVSIRVWECECHYVCASMRILGWLGNENVLIMSNYLKNILLDSIILSTNVKFY